MSKGDYVDAGSPGLLPVGARRAARDIMEYPAKITHILISDVAGNLGDTPVGKKQELFRFLDAEAVQIIPQGYPGIHFKDAAQITFTDADGFG